MSDLIIKLGPHWSRFSRPLNGMTLLGTVQQDAGIGALAQDQRGNYWQINGDHRHKLNASRVAHVLGFATQAGVSGHERSPAVAAAPCSAAPVVTIKRKRVLAISGHRPEP